MCQTVQSPKPTTVIANGLADRPTVDPEVSLEALEYVREAPRDHRSD